MACHVVVNVLCLFLTVPWVGMQYVIVAFSGHTHLFLTPFDLSAAQNSNFSLSLIANLIIKLFFLPLDILSISVQLFK